MINYEAGLVRRGMFGQLVFVLFSTLGIPPNLAIFTVQLLCYSVLLYCVIKMFIGIRQPVHFLPLVMAPFFLAFQVHDEVAGFRKEILFLTLFAFIAYLSTQKSFQQFKTVFVWALLVFPLCVLSHEMLILFLPYFLVLLLIQYPQRLNTAFLITIGGAILLSLTGFMIAFFNTGSAIEVFQICRSWGESAPFRCTEQGGIYWLKGTLADSRGFVVEDFSQSRIKAYSALCLLLVTLPFIYLGPEMKRLFKSHWYILVLLLLMLGGTIALLFFARDWGRVLYIHAVAMSLILLSSSRKQTMLWGKTDSEELYHPKPIIQVTASLIIIVAVVFSLGWRLPHWLGSNPFVNAFTSGVLN